MAHYPFDYNTSKVRKDGTRSQENPYTLHIVNGQQVLERPPGSGHYFNADGSKMEAGDVPPQTPKLKVSAKDQDVDASVPQNVSTKEGNVVKVAQVEAPEDVLSSKDKRK